MSGLYSPDLAIIHSEGYTETFRPGFDWLLERIRATGPRPRLFDLGCGDGTWLSHAAAAGIPGEGVDLSPAFVDLARGRGLQVRTGDAATASIPAGTTAVTALGEVLSYTDPATGRDSLEAVARTALDALPPGGILMADLVGRDGFPTGGQRTGPDWQVRSEVTVTRRLVSRRIETLREGRLSVVHHHQTRRAPEETRALLQAMGWICETGTGYGPCPLLPGRFTIHLTRP